MRRCRVIFQKGLGRFMKNNKTVLITGGTGFLGRYMVQNLIKQNYRVYIITRNTPANINKKSICLQGDILSANFGLDKTTFLKLSSEVNYFFHIAASRDTKDNNKNLYRQNVLGTKNVLRLVRKFRKLKIFNHISSLYVSGMYEGSFPENKLPRISKFHNYYEKTKYISEKLVRNSAVKYQIFRCPILFGDTITGYVKNFDYAIYSIAKTLKKGNQFLLPSEAKGKVMALPVDIVAKFVSRAGIDNRNKNISYNIVDGNPITYKELINVMSEILGVKSNTRIPDLVWKTIVRIAGYFGFLKSLQIFNQNIRFEDSSFKRMVRRYDMIIPPITRSLDKAIKFFKKNYA